MLGIKRSIGLTAAVVAVALAGCGGGGGGSGSGSGSGSTGTFSLSQTSLSFTADENGNPPASQTVDLHLTGSGASFVGAAWPKGGQPSWANVQIVNGSDAADYNVVVSMTTTTLNAGIQTATLEVGTADAQGNILSTQNIQLNYTIANTLSFDNMSQTFNAAYGSPLVQTLSIGVAGTSGKQWTVTSNVPWLTVPSGAQAVGATSFSANVDTSSLGIGTQQGTVTITNTSNATDTATLSVSAIVSAPTVPVAFASAAPAVSAVFGNPVSQNFTITLAGVANKQWQVTSDSSWLTVPNGTKTSGSSIVATVNTAGIPVGNPTGTITLTDVAYPADSATMKVSLAVAAPTISPSVTSILLGGTDGLSSVSQPLSFSINTGTNSYAWTATLSTTDGASWLQSSAGSGNVSATRQTVNVSYNRTGIKGGTYTGSILLSVNVLGQTYKSTVPVTFNLEADNLFVSADGVAFSKFPSSSMLTRTLTVASTIGLTTVPWAASSDQSWLTVTASGTTGGNLVLTADPTSLTADKEYIANVTITSSDSTIENTQKVRVGLWVGSTDPSSASVSITSGAISVATDPVEPYVFVNSGGGSVSVYNVYTGALVTTYSSLAFVVGKMTTSTDGNTLYVADLSLNKILPVTVSTGVVGSIAQQYVLNSSIQFGQDLAYARTKAHPLLIVGTGEILDVATLTSYSAAVAATYSIAVSADGLHLYTLDSGVSPASLSEYTLSYTALNGGTATATYVTGTSPGSSGNDLAVSPDGSLVYTACGYPYQFSVFTGSTLASQTARTGTNYPTNAAVGWNGTFIGGLSKNVVTSVNIYAYDGAGNALGTVSAGSGENLAADTVRLSGDGTRFTAVTVGTSTHLNLITVP